MSNFSKIEYRFQKNAVELFYINYYYLLIFYCFGGETQGKWEVKFEQETFNYKSSNIIKITVYNIINLEYWKFLSWKNQSILINKRRY